jgi:hypothetical protein
VSTVKIKPERSVPIHQSIRRQNLEDLNNFQCGLYNLIYRVAFFSLALWPLRRCRSCLRCYLDKHCEQNNIQPQNMYLYIYIYSRSVCDIFSIRRCRKRRYFCSGQVFQSNKTSTKFKEETTEMLHLERSFV